jgi:hypothetical protein
MKLALVKMAHTIVWALFAVGILAIPVVALAHNFDIYLPLLLARYNKQIFGPLFVVGGVVALAAWLHSR